MSWQIPTSVAGAFASRRPTCPGCAAIERIRRAGRSAPRRKRENGQRCLLDRRLRSGPVVGVDPCEIAIEGRLEFTGDHIENPAELLGPIDPVGRDIPVIAAEPCNALRLRQLRLPPRRLLLGSLA